ncbi:hypothetical protein JCM16303_005716 [Sporobolomyces ruberrimus]
MPIKRTAEELERPPLPRGSACHRCFARKVRCSGQPDPASGVFGCSSCLRTARHRGHDVAQVRCAFEREGLCSEEGGPTLSGEILAGPSSSGATRRQRPSARSNHSSSNNSIRSAVSTSSSARTDSYSTDASSIAPSISTSPRPSSQKFPSALPSPPSNFQFPPPSQLRSSLPPLILPTSVPLSTQALAQVPDDSPTSPELPTPTANATKTMQTLLHRRANAPARQLSLSNVSTPSNGSPYSANSPYIEDYRQQTSAPLMLPPSWPNNGGGGSYPQQQFADYPQQPSLPQYFFDGPLPNTTFALDLAPFSAFTPSTLAKMNLTPTSSYDFASMPPQQPSGITQPAAFSPTGVAFTGSHAAPSTSQPGDPSFSSSLSGYASSSQNDGHPSQQVDPSHLPPPTLSYPPDYSLPLAPPTGFYPQYSHPPPSNHGDTSFHLPSPGLTFSSLAPPDQQPRYYFDRPG